MLHPIKAALALALLFSPAAHAQSVGSYALPSQGHTINGVTRLGDACGGYPLLSADMEDFNAAAVWHPDYGDAVIVTTGLLRAPAAAQRFVLAHECAHFRLGHLIWVASDAAQARWNELAADCAATRYLVSQGDTAAPEAFIALSRQLPVDELHPAWKERIANIRDCMKS